MKTILTLLALPLALAAAPAMAQDCTNRDCGSVAAPTQGEAVEKVSHALAHEIAVQNTAARMMPGRHMDAHADQDREPCEHGEECLEAEGLCRECPKVARGADCADCPNDEPSPTRPA